MSIDMSSRWLVGMGRILLLLKATSNRGFGVGPTPRKLIAENDLSASVMSKLLGMKGQSLADLGKFNAGRAKVRPLHRKWVMSLRARREGKFLCMKVSGMFDEET
jgi:hypothetical protein